MTYTQSIEELQESTNSTIAKMDDRLRTVEIKVFKRILPPKRSR